MYCVSILYLGNLFKMKLNANTCVFAHRRAMLNEVLVQYVCVGVGWGGRWSSNLIYGQGRGDAIVKIQFGNNFLILNHCFRRRKLKQNCSYQFTYTGMFTYTGIF